jgi:hypothetical protein
MGPFDLNIGRCTDDGKSGFCRASLIFTGPQQRLEMIVRAGAFEP